MHVNINRKHKNPSQRWFVPILFEGFCEKWKFSHLPNANGVTIFFEITILVNGTISSPTHSESFYIFPPDQRSPFIFHLANGLLSQDWALLVVKSPDRGVAWDVLDSFTLNCIRQGCMGCPGSEQFYFRLHWKSWVFLLNRALTSAFKLLNISI